MCDKHKSSYMYYISSIRHRRSYVLFEGNIYIFGKPTNYDTWIRYVWKIHAVMTVRRCQWCLFEEIQYDCMNAAKL